MEEQRPDPAEDTSLPRMSEGNAPPAVHEGRGWLSLVFFGGVLPAFTWFIELSTRMCAGSFFDPMPTLVHLLLVLSVPVIHFDALLRRTERAKSIKVQLWLNGFAVGVSAVYALAFLPLLPLAAFAVLMFGMGLLPLSPLFSLVSGLGLRGVLRRRLARAESGMASPETGTIRWRRRVPNLVWTAGLAIMLLLLPEIPTATTRMTLTKAARGETAGERLSGIRFLRSFGSRRDMLTACYEDGRFDDDFFSDGSNAHSMQLGRLVPCDVTTEQARQTWFQVTGMAFNSVPRPVSDRRFSWRSEFDDGLGGDQVAGRVADLSLGSSRIDTSVDTQSLVSYSEWTMMFRNDAFVANEARARLMLPAGGVVTRLTLWVNGEPQEAAFGGASQVKEAYKEVAVRQRRDPVLVTWTAVDQIQMQCFPVPAQGTMQIRLGITSPLNDLSRNSASVHLPRILERNFDIEPELQHAVWISGASDLADGNLQEVNGGHQAAWSNDELIQNDVIAVQLNPVEIDPATYSVSVADPFAADRVVTQTLVIGTAGDSRGVVVVIDGSTALRNTVPMVAAAITELAASVPVEVVVAGDTVRRRSAPSDTAELRSWILYSASSGGTDNVSALLHALDYIEESDRKHVLWLHGTQPVRFPGCDQLTQRLEYATDNVSLVSIPLDDGPNRVLEGLPQTARIRIFRPKREQLGEQLVREFGGDPTTQLRTQRVATDSVLEQPALPENTAEETTTEPRIGSEQVARLWAGEEVIRRLADGLPHEETVAFAVAHQVVTPVSGAVVLETKQQFDAAGLKQVDPSNVPTIPEPEEWVLIIISLIALLVIIARQRRLRAAIR